MQFIIITPNIIYILQSPVETLVMWVEKYIKCFVKYVLTTISCHLSCSWQWMAFLWVSCVACSVAPLPQPYCCQACLPAPLNLPIPPARSGGWAGTGRTHGDSRPPVPGRRWRWWEFGWGRECSSGGALEAPPHRASRIPVFPTGTGCHGSVPDSI